MSNNRDNREHRSRSPVRGGSSSSPHRSYKDRDNDYYHNRDYRHSSKERIGSSRDRYYDGPSSHSRDRYDSYYRSTSRSRDRHSNQRRYNDDKYDNNRAINESTTNGNKPIDIRNTPQYQQYQQQQDSNDSAVSISNNNNDTTNDATMSKTIFVSDLHPRIDDRDLFDYFSIVGVVNDVRMVSDPVTGKSKGFCYVEFDSIDDADTACTLSGQELGGFPIQIQRVDLMNKKQVAKEKRNMNKQDRVTEQQNNTDNNNQDRVGPEYPMQLYIGSLPYNIRDSDIRPIFSAFGELQQLHLHWDDVTQQTKGYGFVTYKYARDAKIALQSLNGIEIAGRAIKVGLSAQSQKQAAALGLIKSDEGVDSYNAGTQGIQNNQQNNYNNNQTTATTPTSSNDYNNILNNIVSNVDKNIDRLDDDHGIRLTKESRHNLMQKLAERNQTITNNINTPNTAISATQQQQSTHQQSQSQSHQQSTTAPNIDTIQRQQPTSCIVLRNMFDPAEELQLNGQNWVNEITIDTRNECSKYGQVQHIYVDPYDINGIVYIRLADIQQAINVYNALNGRYFAGKQIQANYMSEQIYKLKFKE